MKLAISSIVFVAAFVLVGCEKKVEAPAVADAAVVEAADACVDPACCEADASVPVVPLTAPTAPVAAPTTTIKK